MRAANSAALALAGLVAALAMPLRTTFAQDRGVGLGSALVPVDVARFFAIPPDGTGLPEGSGTARVGGAIYAQRCAACHGEQLEGNRAVGGTPLIGGRGTLTSIAPLLTVESYWPYATTLFDYVKRAMPFDQPGSLSDPEVYALSAFILAKGDIISPDAIMDARTLAAVRMPNRNGFVEEKRR